MDVSGQFRSAAALLSASSILKMDEISTPAGNRTPVVQNVIKKANAFPVTGRGGP
jgi:hypothetical protein